MEITNLHGKILSFTYIYEEAWYIGAVHRQHGLYIRIRHKLGFNSFPLVLKYWSAHKPYNERKCVRYNLLYIAQHANR
jgi:hypothetical protein